MQDHEMVDVVPRQAQTYLDVLGEAWVPEARNMGNELIGAWRTAMRNDSEVFVVWAIRDWANWMQVERECIYGSDRVRAWRRRQQGIAVDWKNFLMCRRRCRRFKPDGGLGPFRPVEPVARGSTRARDYFAATGDGGGITGSN